MANDDDATTSTMAKTTMTKTTTTMMTPTMMTPTNGFCFVLLLLSALCERWSDLPYAGLFVKDALINVTWSTLPSSISLS